MRELNQTERDMVAGGLSAEQQGVLDALIASGAISQADADGDKWIPGSLTGTQQLGGQRFRGRITIS